MFRQIHYIQDAFELRAVADLQQLAQDAGRAISSDAPAKLADFHRYLEVRNVTFPELGVKEQKAYQQYEENLKRHLPAFFSRLMAVFPEERFDFINVEAEARNSGGREDFLIRREDDLDLRVSLKNYQKGATRPQFGSGTFNSFLVKLLFDSAGGPGIYLNPQSGETFYCGNKKARDEALRDNDLQDLVPAFEQIDALNLEIKTEFAYGDAARMYDEARVDAARKRCGILGAKLFLELTNIIGSDRIRSAVLTLAGLNEGDDMILIDPKRCTDTFSSARFREIKTGANHPRATVRTERKGQTVYFFIVGPDGRDLLKAGVPFTINTNGCWHRDGEPYEGVQMVLDDKKKPPIPLKYGERRPFKSKQIALSVNTWVEVGRAGIFDLDEV